MEFPQEQKHPSTTLLVTIIIVSLVLGGFLGYFVSNSTTKPEIDRLQVDLLNIKNELSNLQFSEGIVQGNVTYVMGANVSLSPLFEQVRKSIVVVNAIVTQSDRFGRLYYTEVQGSGFICSINGQMLILTNYHVINGASDINVTFVTENSYTATVLGSDKYKDFAILSTDALQNEYSPLEIVSSSTLKVGDSVIVVGTPYGLEGSMSNGIVSALNRTLYTSDYSINNLIQTTAPINPGNSGGPLMTYKGQVVGIVTAIIEDSQGIGFAIPSDMIIEGIENIISSETNSV